MTDVAEDLVEVELRELPVTVFSRAEEHSDGLMREFALIAATESGSAVPRRLLDLADRLEQQYGSYTAGYEREVEAARERGDEFVTVRLQVPAQARAAALEMADMLAEADEFCRNGELLSLVPPPEVLRFRSWYLTQFVDQIDGRPAVSWASFIDAGGS